MALSRRREPRRYPVMRDRETRYLSLRGEMNRLFDDFLHGFDDPLLSSTRPDALREFVPNVAVRAVA